MNNIQNTIIKYYIIQIGTLFYAGGLHSIIFEDRDPEDYNTTEDEMLAHLVFIEEEAIAIAKKLNGIIIPKENSILEISSIINNRDYTEQLSKSCC